MSSIDSFMHNSLVKWITICQNNNLLAFEDFADGRLLWDFFKNIYSRCDNGEMQSKIDDEDDPLFTWLNLVRKIEAFYKDELHMLMITELPDIKKLVREPNKESSIFDIENILILMLGCAVQCNDKEFFIEGIKKMDIEAQSSIMEYIQQVTDNSSYAIPIHALDGDNFSFSRQFIKLISDRSKYYLKNNQISHSPNENRESSKENEIIKMKYQLMNLKEEIEDKDVQLSEFQNEFTTMKTKLINIQTQNFDLIQSSRLMQIYKDELDEYKEKALTLEKYECDLQRQKEKLADLEFYKNQIEDLRGDNERLIDIKLNLENIISANERRQEKLINDLVQTQLILDETQKENETLQLKLSTISDSSASLELEHRMMKEQLSFNRSSHSSLNTLTSAGSLLSIHPVAEEIADTLNKQIHELELERDNLKHELMNVKQELDVYKNDINSNKTDESKLENLNKNPTLEEILDLYSNREYADERLDLNASTELDNNNASFHGRGNANVNETHQLNTSGSSLIVDQDIILKECLRIAERHSDCLTHKLNHVFSKMKELEVTSKNDAEKIRYLQNIIGSIHKEKEFLKKNVSNMQKNSSAHLSNLQAELEVCKNQASTLNMSSDRMKRLVNHEISKYKQQYNHVPTQTIQNTKKHSLQKRCSLYNMQKIDESCIASRSQSPITATKSRSSSHGDESTTSSKTPEKYISSFFSKRDSKSSNSFSRNSNLRSTMPTKLSNSKIVNQIKSSSPVSIEKLVSKNAILRPKSKNLDLKYGQIFDSSTDKQLQQQFTTLKNYEMKCGKNTNPFDKTLIDEDILSLLHCKVTKSCSDRWKFIVDKIIDIHDRNQSLILENSELKKTISSLHFSSDRCEKLEKDNIKLEVENRKLKKIIDAFQSSQSPHDKKVYHYYSHV